MEIITIRLPKWMIQAIDELVEKGLYPNRSEFIREAIRGHLRRYANYLETKGAIVIRESEY